MASCAALRGLGKSQQVFRRCTAHRVCRDARVPRGIFWFFGPEVLSRVASCFFPADSMLELKLVVLLGEFHFSSLLFCLSRIYSVPLLMTVARSGIRLFDLEVGGSWKFFTAH